MWLSCSSALPDDPQTTFGGVESWLESCRWNDANRYTANRAIAAVLGLFALNAGLQVALVMVIRGPYSRGVDWPVYLVGSLATVLNLVAYLPVPFELTKRRGRITGISLTFLAMDWSGAFFSLMTPSPIALSRSWAWNRWRPKRWTFRARPTRRRRAGERL